ncbi:MAG TPA: ribonuclease HI [Gammaproteobacteria bacterium]|nr:ribonuclease HI [Gammaproteobacteria bacterium]|tara:strand:+ start:144 stop:653 length:510 start_codon:yes stop_codon:yes gene_type:complete
MESKCWKITRSKQSNVKKVDVEIYTDGACRGNPGPGGWAALLRTGKNELMVNGAEPDSTNNRMELRAAIEGLATLKRSSVVSITTDSQYVKQGVLSWVEKWKLNGWKTASRKDVKNKDLWQELDELNNMHQVSWYWVKGHSGHAENERVDQAANLAIDLMLDEISVCDK